MYTWTDRRPQIGGRDSVEFDRKEAVFLNTWTDRRPYFCTLGDRLESVFPVCYFKDQRESTVFEIEIFQLSVQIIFTGKSTFQTNNFLTEDKILLSFLVKKFIFRFTYSFFYI